MQFCVQKLCYPKIIFVAVYIDMGTGASDSTKLDFTFDGTYSRKYELKVTQLPCSNEYK